MFSLLETDCSDGTYFEDTFRPGNNFISTKLSVPLNFSFTTSPKEFRIRRISPHEQPVFRLMAFTTSF
ncbi:MAG: hypothetical protein HDT13_06855 [Butyrivibrio sp.]|nr:hypothetical protein [Butyrivibrio sp.]